MKGLIILLLIILILVPISACAQEQPPPTQPISQKVFVGSVNSNIYHYPSCEWAQKISPHNEIWFSSTSDAKTKGYRACKVCRPP